MYYYELQNISRLHQTVADIYTTHSDLAIALSEAHAMATDEDKTGIKPRIPSFIRFILNHVLPTVKLTPHFKGQKKGFVTYHSKGKIKKKRE